MGLRLEVLDEGKQPVEPMNATINFNENWSSGRHPNHSLSILLLLLHLQRKLMLFLLVDELVVDVSNPVVLPPLLVETIAKIYSYNITVNFGDRVTTHFLLN